MDSNGNCDSDHNVCEVASVPDEIPLPDTGDENPAWKKAQEALRGIGAKSKSGGNIGGAVDQQQQESTPVAYPSAYGWPPQLSAFQQQQQMAMAAAASVGYNPYYQFYQDSNTGVPRRRNAQQNQLQPRAQYQFLPRTGQKPPTPTPVGSNSDVSSTSSGGSPLKPVPLAQINVQAGTTQRPGLAGLYFVQFADSHVVVQFFPLWGRGGWRDQIQFI